MANVNSELVQQIANLLTDDPNVVREGLRDLRHPGDGEHSEEGVEVAEGVWADVDYSYDVKTQGRFYAATYDHPAESPDLSIGNASAYITKAYLEDGREVEASSPEEAKAWEKAAIEYFDKYVSDRITDNEYDRFDEYEPEYNPDDRYDNDRYDRAFDR